MKDKYDAIIFFEELPPERQEEVRAAIQDDAELARTFAHWRRFRAAVRARLKAHLPARSLLVLYALEAAGKDDVLDADERQALAHARPGIERVLDLHPGLETAVARIQDDEAAFEAAWTAHFAAAATAPGAGARHAPTDRSPQRSPTRRSPAPSPRRWAWRVGVAAALVLMAVLSVVFFLPREEQTRFTTGPDEVRRVELDDGSTVRLMAGSRLAYTGAAFDRHVALEAGHAFFEVAASEDPFIVETPTARATVLGTSFGLQADETETRIVLADGQVEVASRRTPERAVRLDPGQASRVAREGAPTAPTAVDVVETLSWTGLFVFRDTPMTLIAERLVQHYDTPVAVAPSLHEEGVTGTFEQDQPLAGILETIAATLDARVVTTDDGYRVELNTVE